jgi:hypothetical protein
MASRAQLFDALRRADAAADGGDEDAANDARQIAAILKTKRDETPSLASSAGKAAVRGVTGTLDFINMINPIKLATDVVRHGVGKLTGQEVKDVGFTDKAAELGLTYGDLEELPRTHRPLAVGVETVVGSMIPGGVAVQGLRTATQVPKFLKGAQALAKRSPKAFLAAEAAASAGAAQGGVGAEIFAPGNVPARVGAEIAGGFVSPLSIPGRLYRGVGRMLGRDSKALPAITRSQAEGRAAETIRKVIAESGEDEQAIIKALEGADASGPLSSARAAESQALQNLEAKVVAERPEVGFAIDEQTKTILTAQREAIDAFSRTGDPGALRVAAATRQRYLTDLLNRRLQQAQGEARTARSAIGTGGRAAQAEASQRANQALEDALSDATATERELWAAVPRDRTLQATSNFDAAVQSARGQLLPNEKLSEPIAGYVADLAQRNSKPTTGEFLTLRSRALELAREARSKGDWGTNSRMSAIADGALRDLESLDLPEAEAARAFSRAKHDAFTRTFAGRALADAPTGGERIPPEIMLERAFGAGGTGGALRFGELQGAAGFAPSRAGTTAPAMRSSQEEFLRAQVSRLADPETGAIAPARLQKFMSENEELLRAFPGVRSELQRASVSQARAGVVGESVAAGRTSVETALGKILNVEDPAAAVGRILGGGNPTRDYLGMARMARQSGREATEGLRAATLRDVIGRSTRDGEISFTTLKDQLISGKRNVLDLMERSGVATPEIAARLRQLVLRAARLEAAKGDPRAVPELVDVPDKMLDTMTRIVGAKAGGWIGRLFGGGGGLVPTTAGSRRAQEMMKALMTRTTDVLIEAVREPKLMADLLKRPKTAAEAALIEGRLHGFLVNAGIVATEPEQETQ